jgi:hypothetical protein
LIYFLVNNNYHLLDVYEHCKYLKSYEKSLIQIPHTLECIQESGIFNNIYTFNTPFKGLKNFFNVFKAKQIEKNIKNKISVTKDDILFVYTEYEVLNQYVISLFKKNGAKVYVIEDGGFATYLTYSVLNEGKLTLKEIIKLLYLKYILGYKFVKFLKYNGIVFPQIEDKFIDGVLLYLDVKIIRNIKKILISKNHRKLTLNEKKAIFLNEKMYDYYCSKKEHKIILNDILQKMSQKFEKIYFKFHPRETEDDKKWQLKILNQYHNVQIIEEKTPIENLLEKYDAKYVFSFFSAALLNVNAMGAIPVYVYHLYDRIAENSVFKQIDSVLKNLSYNFIDKDYNCKNVGFNIKSVKNYKSILDVVDNN